MKSLVNYILEGKAKSFSSKEDFRADNNSNWDNDSSNADKVMSFIYSKLSSSARTYLEDENKKGSYNKDNEVSFDVTSKCWNLKDICKDASLEYDKKLKFAPTILITIHYCDDIDKIASIVNNKFLTKAFKNRNKYLVNDSDSANKMYYKVDDGSDYVDNSKFEYDKFLRIIMPLYDLDDVIKILNYIGENKDEVIDYADKKKITSGEYKKSDKKTKNSKKSNAGVKPISGVSQETKDFFKVIDEHIDSVGEDYGYQRNEIEINKFKEFVNKNYPNGKFETISERYSDDWVDKLDGIEPEFDFAPYIDDDERWVGIVEYKNKVYIESFIDLDYPIIYKV